jgi:hypothetical protein
MVLEAIAEQGDSEQIDLAWSEHELEDPTIELEAFSFGFNSFVLLTSAPDAP